MFRSFASWNAQAHICVFISNLLMPADHLRFNSVDNKQHFKSTKKMKLYRVQT